MAKKKHQDVVKSNALVVASDRPDSLYQHRLLIAGLATLRAKQKLEPDHIFSITAADLSKLTGTRIVWADLCRAADELVKRVVVLEDYKPTARAKPRQRKTHYVKWIDYEKGGGKISWTLTPEIIPELTELTDNFTKYSIETMLRLRSTYGVRLYELAKFWHDNRKHLKEAIAYFTIADFRQSLKVEDTYARTDKLRTKVIERAVDDINANTDLLIRWEWDKVGKRVVGIQFAVSSNATKNLAAPETTTTGRQKYKAIKDGQNLVSGKASHAYISRWAKAGETAHDAQMRLSQELRGGKDRDIEKAAAAGKKV